MIVKNLNKNTNFQTYIGTYYIIVTLHVQLQPPYDFLPLVLANLVIGIIR